MDCSKNKLQYKLKSWGIRRNLDEKTWKFIDHRIKKRDMQGKRSLVIRSGVRLAPEEVEKGRARYNRPSICDKF